VGRSFVGLVALLLAPAGFASAQKLEPPPSQAAFRAFLTQFQEKSESEKDAAAFGALEQARASALAQTLNERLAFSGWLLELKGIEPTPRGGYFVRFVDPGLSDSRRTRPTFWNGGPGRIGRETVIPPGSPLYEALRTMKPGMRAFVSGHFYADGYGGPLFESSTVNLGANEAGKAKFRMPYFSVQFTSIVPE
jgi:hypothetical protein